MDSFMYGVRQSTTIYRHRQSNQARHANQIDQEPKTHVGRSARGSVRRSRARGRAPSGRRASRRGRTPRCGGRPRAGAGRRRAACCPSRRSARPGRTTRRPRAPTRRARGRASWPPPAAGRSGRARWRWRPLRRCRRRPPGPGAAPACSARRTRRPWGLWWCGVVWCT